jgi:23S rRNA pseudouridine1911/1915/1917 synthase
MESTNFFTVIYQDHHLLIVNKPAGVVVHPTYKHADGTMWDALLVYLAEQGGDDWQPPDLPDEPEWSGAPEHIQVMLREKRTERLWKEGGLLARPCLLHRLDKDTSGVVAIARTELSCRHIIRQFKDHTIVKRYLAVVSEGAPDWARPRTDFRITRRQGEHREIELDIPLVLSSFQGDELVLDGPLQRDPGERRRCIVGPDGQNAVTILKVQAVDGPFALLEIRLVTGRTHQIRAHLAAMGYAIVGDRIYAQPAEDASPQAALGRQFLHAYCLELRRYPDNELCKFVAPLASDLQSWLEHYFPTWLGVLDASAVSA